MIRKQVYIKAAHEASLKRAARAGGVSEALIIRRGIDMAAREQMAPTSQDNALVEQAWREIDAVLEARKRLKVSQSVTGWTRDDLYEERLARITP